MTEDEMDGITNSVDLSFEHTLGLRDGQGGLVCCGPRGRRVGHNGAAGLTDGVIDRGPGLPTGPLPSTGCTVTAVWGKAHTCCWGSLVLV